ncbi:LOW QUALITY PROTEIN: DBF4-type zinc finger-containing protein 2 [Marmota flaviventris]|uniref:LOW QUALITY PROTEIN: DBF4-type zinc finger-containing protein 2 n=1 Tax=Marmota flaviventris TaxID=93162 RepID=UPI003A8B8A5D
MQRKQGYCSYCRVQYPNLEQETKIKGICHQQTLTKGKTKRSSSGRRKMIPDGSSEIQEVMKSNGKHLFSAQHRSLTRQSRRRICTSSLMERFLQDVLRHHPYNYQENRGAQNEMSMNAASPEVVHLEDFFSEEYAQDTPETIEEETLSESSDSVEELTSEPSDQSQEPVREISIRPSVIQKLEKGQQQSLEFVPKIESGGMKRINPVDIGQATNSGKNPVRPPVICNAPASCLPERSYDRPVATTTARLPLAVHLDSVSKCDPNKAHTHLEQLDMVSRNPVPSALVGTSVSYKNPKESNRKPLCVNSDKLVLQKEVKSQGELSPGFKFCELKGTENSVRVKSSSRLASNLAGNLNKTDKPSDRGVFGDAIPKHHEEFLSNMDCSQEEEHLVFKKSSFLKQKFSLSSEVKFDCGPLQSAADQSQEAVQDLSLWKEERVDQEDENYESRGSEMSFDCGSSCHSLTDQSEMSDREINLLEETHADLTHKNKKSCVSEKISDRNDSLQAVTRQSQVIVKEEGLQNTARISLVDESYDTSGSEMNSDYDEDLPQSAKKYRQQPVKEVDLPQEVHISLVDRDYGCTSSESSADSIFSLESVVDESSVVVTEKQVWKKAHVRLVDASYGSSCSESSFDCDASPQSVVDQPQMTVKEKKLKHRHVHLKNKKRKPSRAKAHLDCGVSLETVADEPQRAVEEKNLLKAKNADLVDMNCESHGPEMGFHADAQLVADESQVAVKEVNPQKVDNDLENNKSIPSSISYLSFDSHAFFYQSANDQPQGALGEVNLKELNVDMEVKSYGCSSSELTFDSDSPLLSVTERSQLDVERIKEDINLEDESCESNSSDITFDSDIPDCSVVDQPEVAVGEEEPVDLENKSNESCISEITFDSDIPLHSGNDHPEVAVKEVIIQEEEYVHLERKNDKLIDSEINLDSYAPLHSVTNPPEVADKKLNPQREEQVLFKNKENEPADSELSLAYHTIFPSMTGHSEDPFKDINFEKEVHVPFENKTNELSASETRLDSDIPLQSVIQKPTVVVKNIWLQKEKYAEFQDKNAELTDSEINSDSDIPHYPMAEPQVAVKRKEKKKHIVEKSHYHGDSELLFSSEILPQSIAEKPQSAILEKDHVKPEGRSTVLKCFGINVNIDASLHSITDQPHLALLKEKHVDLKDESSTPSTSKIHFNLVDPLQTLPKRPEVIKSTNQWKEETMHLENKIDEPSGSKAVRNTDISLQSTANPPEVAIKQVNLASEDQMYLESKNSQYNSERSLDSDFLVQEVVSQPQITTLEPEHFEVEGKHSQSCDSEVSFDSDDSLQSVADQLGETVKEISHWKDEDIDMEDKRDEAKSFKTIYDSDVLKPAADQTEEVVPGMNLWKEHVDLGDKIVNPSDRVTEKKINFDSDKTLQSVTKIQEPAKEINLSREGHVCLDDKVYEPCGSRIIYVSNIPFQSVIQGPQILEERPANLEVKNSDPCGPEIRFDSSDSCQSVAGQLQKSITEINLKEDHIYLEDKSYKLVDCEACYDSDVPVQFVADQSHVSVKEINLQKEDQNDLEDNNYTPCCSEIRCDSGVHLQSEVDPSQMTYKETTFQKRELLGMEEKSSEPSDSEMMSDSDVSFQIVVNSSSQTSDGESDSPPVVFVDVMASDSDCDREVISDSNVPLELVTDPPPMTIPETSCINTESIDVGNNYCNYCGSQLRSVLEASSHSVASQPKKSFKIINRKNDYIILGDSTCQSCGNEIDFSGDASDQSMTYQSQGPDRSIDSEDKSCEYNRTERNFNLESSTQSVTHQVQQTDKEDNLWKDQKDKSCESNVSATGSTSSSTSVICQTTVRKSALKSKRRDQESCKSCFERGFQCDPSHHSDSNQPGEAVKKRPVKRVTFDLGEKSRDSQSGSAPKTGSGRNLGKDKEVMDDLDAPVIEALSQILPSSLGRKWSRIIRENHSKINALMKDFKEGHFRCYFNNEAKTQIITLYKERHIAWPIFNQTTASVQTVSSFEDIAGGFSDIDDCVVAVEKPNCHYPLAERLLSKQNLFVASQSQIEKVSHGTQTSFISYPLKKRKIVRLEVESPKKKCVQSDGKEKKIIKIGTVELPGSQIKVLEPGQPKPVIRILTSINIKPKEDESCDSPKVNHCVCDNDLQFLCKYKQSNHNCPSLLKIVNNFPSNVVISESDICCKCHIHHESDLNSSEGDSDAVQNHASTSQMIIPARYELRSRCRTSESSTFLETSEAVNASEFPEEGSFQLTLLSRDVAKISPKPVKYEFLESKRKKKIQRKNVMRNPSFPKKVFKAVILHQNARTASEKWSVWIRTKANDIIRKYISKYSAFLRHRYQSRTTLFRMHLKKKKSGASRLEEVDKSTQTLSDTSVTPAGAKEKLRAIVSPLKQPAQRTSRAVGRRAVGRRAVGRRAVGSRAVGRSAVGRKKAKRRNRRKKKRPIPVREYDLRSSCYIPDSDRMVTRLASKMKSNEVK